MKILNFLCVVILSYILCSCLVPPPAVVNQVVLPEETLMRYRKFIPSDEQITSKSHQWVETKLSDGSVKKRMYYPEKYQCTHEMTYHPEDRNLLHGPYNEWWDDGFKKDEGQYEKGKKSGSWKSYSITDGTLTKEMNYINGDINGEVKNYTKEILRSKYTYDMGVREGLFSVYDSLGVVINEGIYKADTIFSQTLEKEKDNETFKVVEKMPKFPGCAEIEDEEEQKFCAQRKMLEFIYSNIRYPKDARDKNIEGMAIIRFVIDKDGSISDVTTVRGVSQSIEAESRRVVNAMPKWEPGYQRGKAVKVQFNLPVKFKLQ